jgi:hypothetical protein
MIYLLFSSDDDNADAAKDFVMASDCEEYVYDELHELIDNGWARYRSWWLVETDLNDPYNNVTKLVRSRD